MKKAFAIVCLTVICLLTIPVFAQEKTVSQKVSQGSARDPQLLIKTTNVTPSTSSVYPKGFESGAEFRKLFQGGGPYDYINPAAEILDKRDLTTKHFQTSDNKVITIASAGPVHYKKNGLWNTILNDISPSSQIAGFGYANTNNRFQTFYGNSLQGGIKIITEHNEELNLMQDAAIVYLDKNFHETGNAGLLGGNVQHAQENFIGYENLYNGVNAVIEHNAAGYELNYELQNLSSIQIPVGTEFVSFREGISVPSGCHAVTAEDNKGIYIQDNQGRNLLRYKLPVFYEKNDPTSNESRLNGNYFTEEKNGKVYIHVLVPVTWLTDPRHQFPLVIDPVVTVTPQNAFAWTFTVEEDAGCDYATDNDQDDNMRVGFDDGTIDNDYYQCYATYDISSIPDANCIQSAYVSFYEYNWNNPRNDDNQLDFYFQAYDPIASNPIGLTCDQNYADIDATGTVYRQYNVWGNCGGACTDFDETPNQWKNFPDNVGARVSAALVYDFVAFSLDKFNNSHSDPGLSLFNCGLCGSCGFFCCSCTPNNDEWIDFRGYSNANRPQLVITHDAPYVAATSISGTTTICAGTSTTLTRVGGTTGGGGAWRWYTGSCGGTLVGSGDNITVSPATTTTYYLRGEGTCGNTACVSVTVTVQTLSVAPTSISGTSTICSGNSTTLTEVGGTLGTGAVYNWYTASCGGTYIGSGTSITVSPVVNTTYYVRAQGTCNTTSCASVTVTINSPSVAPGSITGTSVICNGQSTTLSVSGGSLGSGATWQWYTVSCGGTNAGTGASITVSPSTTTTYYVRAVGTCNTTTCVSLTVTVNLLSVAPTSISGTNVICNGGNTTLSVVGGSLGTGANWQWYSGNCGGTSVGNGTSVSVSPTVTTTYFVRAEGTCNNTTCAQITVTVNQPSVAPTAVSGLTTICNGVSTTLSVVGGSLGTGATWQWYSGSCGGTAAGSGTSITVSPSSTTDYFVRAVGTCNTTSCAFTTVTVQDTSIPAASVSGSTAICIGSSTNLSVTGGSLGTAANWEWYIGSCGGTHVGSGAVLSNVSPAITTTYFVRAEGLCNTTICKSFVLNVNPLPNGSISGSTQVCSGIDTVLTFNFAVGTAPFDVIYTDGTNVFTKTGVNNGDTIRVLPVGTTTYSVQQITDANGCVRTTGFLGAATITVAPLPVISNVSISDVLCNGGNTGSITLTASSGTPTFVYSIDNGVTYQSGNSFAGLTAGTYYPMVSDALNCASLPTNGVQVNEPQVLDHTNVVQNASCDNVFDGSITVNAIGGTTPYTYSLNNGPTQLGNVFSGLLTGNYVVQVVDFNGCYDTSHVFIDTAYGVHASIVSQTDVSCFGGVDGTVTVQLTGGVPPYSYSINGVQFVSSPTFTGLASGNYLVTLRDSKGCTDFANVTIIQPNLLQAFVDSTHNILCNGDTTGAIYITVTGGNGGNSFVWSNGLTTEDITGIGAGTYNVAITDSKGCSTSTGVTISQPALLVVVLAGHADVTCNGGNNGSIDINVFGGTPLYTYSWTNGATNEDLNALTIGTYAVTVTDANACTATFTTSISEPAAITSTLTKTDVTCPGASNGSADLTVSGGVSPYTYLWSNGATSEDLSNVTGGTYTVIITDLNNCTAANSITINEGLPLTISGVVTDVLCNGGSTGAIVTTVSGGIPAYTYNWSNSATGPDLNNISAGNYTVTVADVNSCSASASFVVSQPAGLVVSATTVNVGCAGGSNGSVDITVYGGVFAYTYNWSNSSTNEDLHNISGGNYDVTITDANLCTLTATYTIAEPSAIVSSTTHTDVSCHGADDATANLTLSGGTAPYTFFWSNFLATQNVAGLHGGLYFVVITDANGCEKRDSALIAEPQVLQFDSVLIKDISCYNSNDGAVHVYVSGGTQPYVYNWSDNSHADSLASLQNGVYAVTVIDAHNCTVTTSVTIVNPSAITANFVAQNPLCFGESNGAIDLIPTGGLPGYFYNWSNSAITEDISGLVAGTYSVTITDSKGCTVTDSRTIVDPAPFLVSGIKKNITCHAYGNGSVLTSAYGGTPPYGYYWVDSISGLNISNGPFIDNLSGGNYYVTTTDANGCSAISNYTLIDPAQLTSHIDVVDATCFGTNTGSIKAVVLGGVRPYHYLWNNFAVDSFQQGIAAGHYVVQVIDTNGCFLYDSINVNQPTEILVAGTTTNVVCYGDSTGGVTLTVSGGVPGYTFAWSNGTANQDLTAAVAGTYTATISDANACSKTNSFTLTQGVRIIPSLAALNPICHGGSTGSITAIVSGGVQPYSYAWSNAQSSVAIGALHAGGYSLTVTDAANCSVSDSATLVDPAIIDVTTNANASKCFNTANGSVVTNITGGTAPYTFLLNGAAQDSGTFAGLLPGNYLLLVTDVNGCQGNSNFTVATPGQISVSVVSAEQVILTGMETQLTATATTDSTAQILHYFWEPDTSVFDFRDCVDPTNCNKPFVAPRTTTTFMVTVMSSDSCYASDTVTVQVLRQPSAFIPTAFTPNNDGLNDRFEFDILGATNIDITIFNRWGSKVYSNPSQENKITGHSGWDGNVNGKLAPYDTYVYQMKVTYWDESTTDFTGTVTLMK